MPLPETDTTRLDLTGYIPGCIGRIVQLHADYYHRNWNFGLFFEARVAADLSAFLSRFRPQSDGFWTLHHNSDTQAAIAIDAHQADRSGAHLRWFIVAEAWRGRGLGRRLLNTAVSFCQAKGYKSVFLWTFQGLEAARHLYEDSGFRCIAQATGRQWGTTVVEQQYELLLNPCSPADGIDEQTRPD